MVQLLNRNGVAVRLFWNTGKIRFMDTKVGKNWVIGEGKRCLEVQKKAADMDTAYRDGSYFSYFAALSSAFW